MADKLDMLLSDYMTGMLQVKINSRERWITREKHEEKIGSVGSSSNTAPQERNFLIKEGDKELQKMLDRKQTLDELMDVIQGTKVKEIVIARFKYRLSWCKVGQRVFLDEDAARKQYAGFKKTLRDGLWRDTLD